MRGRNHPFSKHINNSAQKAIAKRQAIGQALEKKIRIAPYANGNGGGFTAFCPDGSVKYLNSEGEMIDFVRSYQG